MTLPVVFSFLLSFAIGILVVSLFWPAARFPLLPLFLAFGLGQGVTSCVVFLFLLVHGRVAKSYPIVELLLLALLAVLFFWLRKRRVVSAEEARPRLRYEFVFAIAFYGSLAAALAVLTFDLWRTPDGIWDAWAIYNLRARGIFRGGEAWRDTFSTVIPWSHPGYPLLLQLSAVRGWIYAGRELIAVPVTLAWLFTVSTLGTVVAGVAILRGRAQAYLAGIVLLGYTYFITHGSSQYADVPLMFFFTAAIVLFALHLGADDDLRRSGRFLLLAGLATGMAAWTKNEGLLFVAAASAAHLVVTLREKDFRAYLRELAFFAAGLLPGLLCLAIFKWAIAPPSELIAAMGAESMLPKITNFSRYVLIVKELVYRVIHYTGRGMNLAYVLVIYAALVGATRKRKTSVVFGVVLLALMLLGYAWVYLTTPYELGWHMHWSMDRLLLGLWPSFVVTFFLFVPAPEEIFRYDAR